MVSSWSTRVPAALAAALLIAACTDSHGQGSRRTGPDKSTETGNPPVIDVARVALVVSSDEVHVVGEPGAVTPGRGEVVVERLGGDEVWRGDVAQDGAFDVLVEGSLDDTFVLRAIGDGEDDVSAPVYLYRGGATVGSGGGVPSCEERREIATEVFAQAAAAADRSCDSDDDCVQGPTPDSCPYWLCWGPPVSQRGATELAQTATTIDTDLCEPGRTEGCFMHSSVVDCGGPTLVCRDGQCSDCVAEPCPPPVCAGCGESDISWQDFQGMGTDATYSITNCSIFTATFPDGSTCTSDLPCSAAPPCEDCSNGRGYSAAYLNALLEHPDVVPALANGETFGAQTRDAAVFLVTTSLGTLSAKNQPCGDMPGCVDAPEGVLALRQVLADIVVQQPCPVPASACELPFDAGGGPGTLLVYTFHAQTGTCIPTYYSGIGGNANRFDDLASCRAACPNTASEGGCPPNRTFVSELCLQCGGVGDCTETAPACAKLCTSDDDCAGEPATCSGAGLCEARLCM